MKTILFILVMMLFSSSGSTSLSIHGKVLDGSTGQGLPGVTIHIKGTTQGTVSQADGSFDIELPNTGATLIFSFVGYQIQEIEVTSSEFLIVTMLEDVMALEEIVVTGYATQKRVEKDMLGSVADLRGMELNESSALQGRVAGVAISSASPTNYPGNNRRYQSAPPQPPNTESYASIAENGYKNPRQEPLSTFSIDVDAASYSNVRRFITDGQRPDRDAVRIEEMINYFDYDYPQPEDGNPFSITYELSDCPWNANNKLLHIGLQGERMDNSEIPPSNLVFLIDVSGSMNSANKLPLLKNAMKLLVSQLRPSDRVAIVVYAGSSGLVLPSTPGNQKDRIISALERLNAGGSTAGAAGLRLAYNTAEEHFIEEGNNRIILATDGDFNVGPSSNSDMERMIEHYRDRGIFISVMGFGMGNYKDDKMEIIADKGNGNYAYIDNLMEAKKVFINEFSSTLYTIAKDVKIQIEFNPAYVQEYRLVGYENRLLNEEDFDNDRKDAGELGAGHTVTALYEIVPPGAGRTRRLRYQEQEMITDGPDNNELATIHFRYKRPDANRSILLTRVVPNNARDLNETSENFRFSAAVAGFGMLLRDSDYADDLTYSDVLSLARGSRGIDEDGYRAEFIHLVELSESFLLGSRWEW